MPGSTAGLLSAGCEATIRGPLRVYGEIGLGVALGESAGVSLPHGHLGIRLRF